MSHSAFSDRVLYLLTYLLNYLHIPGRVSILFRESFQLSRSSDEALVTACAQWLQWFCEAGGGAHLTKPGWSELHTHSNPTNLALFRRKIALYRFNQGGLVLLQGAQVGAGGGASLPPHFNHCLCQNLTGRSCHRANSVKSLNGWRAHHGQ